MMTTSRVVAITKVDCCTNYVSGYAEVAVLPPETSLRVGEYIQDSFQRILYALIARCTHIREGYEAMVRRSVSGIEESLVTVMVRGGTKLFRTLATEPRSNDSFCAASTSGSLGARPPKWISAWDRTPGSAGSRSQVIVSFNEFDVRGTKTLLKAWGVACDLCIGWSRGTSIMHLVSCLSFRSFSPQILTAQDSFILRFFV